MLRRGFGRYPAQCCWSGFLAPTTPSGGIETAADNAGAIAITIRRITVAGAIARTISDVQMPGMNGIELQS